MTIAVNLKTHRLTNTDRKRMHLDRKVSGDRLRWDLPLRETPRPRGLGEKFELHDGGRRSKRDGMGGDRLQRVPSCLTGCYDASITARDVFTVFLLPYDL